jgi:hypothetical protein
MSQIKFNFPAYLAYGKINTESYHYDEATKEHTVLYEYESKPYLKVEVGEKSTLITEYVDGNRQSISSRKTMKEAMFSHFSSINPLNYAAQGTWISSMIGLGGIYVEFFTSHCIKQLFYPALFLIDIRIPLSDSKLKEAQDLITTPLSQKFNPWIQESQITITYSDHIEVVKKRLLSVICPIAYSLDLVKQVKSQGLIEKEKVFRPLVTLATPEKGNRVKNFFGRDEDAWEMYNVSYQIDQQTETL